MHASLPLSQACHVAHVAADDLASAKQPIDTDKKAAAACAAFSSALRPALSACAQDDAQDEVRAAAATALLALESCGSA